MASPVLESVESFDVAYEFTATTFKKTSRLPHPPETLPDGTIFIWFRSWNHERITNEAKALEFVAKKTTIPVPRLIEHGIHPDGRRYLITERLDGIMLHNIQEQGCLRPKAQQHTEEEVCKTCVDQAYSNALAFITDVFLPQLSELTSKERGLDGFVMPPRWLSVDTQPPWKRNKAAFRTLPRKTAEYIFQHGDLAAHNIMMHRETLQVQAVLDWEYAGFYPAGMNRWSGTLDMEAYRQLGLDSGPAIAEFLAEEYLECYETWPDKKQLESLVRNGEIPDPVELKKKLGSC
ncbi:hypothetical protein NHJ13734_005033 [Beauveria thailandica]